MRKNLWIILALSIMMLTITGCSSIGNSGTKKYYTGYDSLELTLGAESPPTQIIYDSESKDNEFTVAIQVKNKGASDAYGPIFVTGYDTNFISFNGNIKPGQNHVRVSNTNYNVNFVIAGVAIGSRGDMSGNTRTTVGFQTPPNSDGQSFTYGAQVFTRDGKVRDLNININLKSMRIGNTAGAIALEIFSRNFGYDGFMALEGQTPETPAGGLEVYEFPAYIYDFSESLENFQQNILVTACYSYATHATAIVCMDPKPNSNSKKVCKAGPVSLSGGQGGPIAVTRIEQQASSSKVVFTIYIHHQKKSSDDMLYDIYQLYKCADSGATSKANDLNIVYIDDIKVSDNDVTQYCTPSQKIRLDESGNGVITCTAPFYGTESSTAYLAPIEMNFIYGYSKSVQRNINIKRI